MSDSILAHQKSWKSFQKSAVPYYASFKRGLDMIVSLLILVLTSPLSLVIALGIRLSSSGKVIYRQQRIGKDGKLFDMLKFRTMKIENTSDLHREYVQKLIRENYSPEDIGRNSLKMKSDSRITGFGRFLRNTSLDEIPQFINVLRGEMSIVGPRPSLPYEFEVYQEWHKRRLSVLPGITGLWQVTAHNTVRFDDMVRIDLDYIERMNLVLDFLIVIKTPFEMLFGRGRG